MKTTNILLIGALLVAVSFGTEAKQLDTTILGIPPGDAPLCNVTNLDKTKAVTVHVTVFMVDGSVGAETDDTLAPGNSNGLSLPPSPSFTYARCSFRFPNKYSGSIRAALALLNGSGETVSALPAE